MGDITIAVDTRALDAALEVLGPKRGGAAIGRALNKTATAVRREVLRTVSREIGKPQKDFNNAVRVRPVRIAALGRLTSGREGVVGRGVRATATVTAVGADISVSRFKAKQTKEGVTFKPGRKVKRRAIRSAFIATVRGGVMQVFVRAANAQNVRVDHVQIRHRRVRPRGPDLPIAKVTVPGVSTVMLDQAIQGAIQADGQATLTKRLAEEVRFELLKATGRIPPRPRKSRIR